MGLFEQFPYTNFHELNLDWFLSTFNELIAEWEAQKVEFSDLKDAWQQLHDYVENYFDNLDVQQEINNKLDEMAASGELDAILYRIVGPFIDEYNGRIHVLEARMDTFASLPAGSTAGNAELLDIRVANDGETYASAGDAVRAQADILQSEIDQTGSYQSWVTFVKNSGYRYDFYDNFNMISASGYYACECAAEPYMEYTIRARNVGTNTTFAIAFFQGSTVLGYLDSEPASAEHTVVCRTPANCDTIRFTTNNDSTPIIKVTVKRYGKLPVVYVATNGSDDWTGEDSHPFQHIQTAINSTIGDVIKIGGGRYQEDIVASYRDKLHLIGDPTTPVIIDKTTTITTAPDAGTGLRKGSFASAAGDLIYEVFVTQSEPIADTSGNAIAYTVNLWEYYGTQMMIPKLTIPEVQATPNTWTYDGTYIYVNAADTYYKLINNNTDYAGHFENIDDLTIENIEFDYSGSSNCLIETCFNARVINCVFQSSGTLHGLAFSNSNALIEKCRSFKNCFDGFNIHDKGNTTFIDCESGYNRDDGMSHHDGSTGTVIGGNFHHNYKGGISPTYDAAVNIYNAVCASNGYGVYYAAPSGTIACIMDSCTLLNNTGYGLRVHGTYDIKSLHTLYDGNANRQYADNGGSIYELGSN